MTELYIDPQDQHKPIGPPLSPNHGKGLDGVHYWKQLYYPGGGGTATFIAISQLTSYKAFFSYEPTWFPLGVTFKLI